MRVWLQKQKKKEEAKVAAQVATPPVDAPTAALEVQPVGESVEKPMESVEEALKAEDFTAQPTSGATDDAEDGRQRAGSASAQPTEVGLLLFLSIGSCALYGQWLGGRAGKHESAGVTIGGDNTLDNEHGVHVARIPLLTPYRT